MQNYLNNADAKALEAGVPTAPTVESAKVGLTTKTSLTTKFSVETACQTIVPGKAIEKPQTFIKGVTGVLKTDAEIEESPAITSEDGRVVIKKRDTWNSKSGAYGAVTAIRVDGLTRAYFKHYPVHFLDGSELMKLMVSWTHGIKTKFNGAEIREMDPQFEGLCVKVLADNNGNLRFVTKKKAQLCKEHEELLMSLLSEDGKLALQTHVCIGDTLTFRLVHPKVTFVNGPFDLSKPAAILVAINDKHIRSPSDLPLGTMVPKAFTTTADVVATMDMGQLKNAAVMAELYDAETGVTSYVKLVTHQLAANIKLLEDINGNMRTAVARAGSSGLDKLREALHPYHLPSLEEAVKVLSAGPEVVAKFVKANRGALLDKEDRSGLITALFKMDAKRAERLVKCAKLYNKDEKFFSGLDPVMMASHVKLMEIVESKLTHANPDVAAAAKLIKRIGTPGPYKP